MNIGILIEHRGINEGYGNCAVLNERGLSIVAPVQIARHESRVVSEERERGEEEGKEREKKNIDPWLCHKHGIV